MADRGNHGPWPGNGRAGSLSRPGFVLFVLWLMVFAICSQVNIIIPILPRIGEALYIPAQLQGTLVSAYAIVVGISAIFAGPLSDRIGRRRIMLLGCSAMAAALLLHAVASSFEALFVLRALAGLAGGMLSGSAAAYVGDYFPPSKRGRATGFVLSGVAVGQMVGIPAGTLLANTVDFRWAFAVLAGLMAAAAVSIWMVIPRLVVSEGGRGFSLRFVLRAHRRVLAYGSIRVVLLSNIIILTGINIYFVYMPLWMEDGLGVDGRSVALLFFLGGVLGFVGSPVVGRMSDRMGAATVIGLACIGFAALAAISPSVGMVPMAAYALFPLLMLAMTAQNVPVWSLVTTLVSRRERGTLMSLTYSTGQVGMGIGGALAGLAYQGYGFGANVMIAAVLLLAMSLVVWRFFPMESAGV